MHTKVKQSSQTPPVATARRTGDENRDPQVQVSDLVGRFGVLRGVRAHASDSLSRMLRRATYLPGV